MSFEPKAPLSVLANETSELSVILQKAALLSRLEAAFLPLLPKTLAKHCQIAHAADQTLTILVSSGSNATELKFLTDDLYAQFKRIPELSSYRSLLVKVRPPLAPSQKRQTQEKIRRPACPPSAKSLEAIKEAAEGITDEGLKAALLKFLPSKA